MIKRNYILKTVGPLHTGSDIQAGTLRTLRRQKCMLPEPVIHQSRIPEDLRRDAIVHILLGIWDAIDKDGIKGRRLMGIWDEFANKMLAAARVGTRHRFLEVLSRSWGIESVRNLNVLRALDALSDHDVLDTVRNESIYLVLKLRALRDEAKEQKEQTGRYLFDLPAIEPLTDPVEVTRESDEIPCISGNSFRGRMRRMAMRDFCRRVGLGTPESRIPKRAYYVLFSGGMLDQSTKYEDFDKLEAMVSACPMLGVLGGAVGNMTIEGDAKIGWAYPLCRERETGALSYWEFLDTVFQTRSDSSKTERELEMEDDTKDDAAAQQMKYEYEVFADGSLFEWRVACEAQDPLIASAFWRMMRLFGEDPNIGGMGAVGNGTLDIEPSPASDPECDDSEYLAHLTENAEAIRGYWVNAKI